MSDTTRSPSAVDPSELNPGSAVVADLDKRIGPYHILGLLGAGGMGEVYKAERRHPIQQTVAIKIIKLGFDSREVIARFDSERQALARMDHPHIARVIDAGVSETGRPYFVMEYAPGVPITKFCDDHRLSIKDRLHLFTQACDAISHAHTKAIIHRDIKAANVLAFMHDDQPTVKVIDFGIAKALTGDRLTQATFNTDAGSMVGTLDSMSPEQADGSPDIDTRTDVYSLGVLLYELLTGTKPFDHGTLVRAGNDEMKRIIREVEPPRPNVRLSSLGGDATRVAEMRQARPETLRRQLRGELGWIPLKAIRKERQRRYASVHQLKHDVQNFLDGQPLMAGPERRSYRLRKFTQRNWRGLAAVIAVFVMIAGGTAFYIRRIRAEQARTQAALALAQSRFDDVRKLANTFLFDVHDKIADLAGATPARALLVRTALDYLNKLNAQAGDDRALLSEIASAYERVGDVQGNPNNSNLGDLSGALESYRKSLAIRQKLAEPDPANVAARRDVSASYIKVGDVLDESGDTKAALQSYRSSLAIDQKLVDADPADALAQRSLAYSYAKSADMLAKSGDTEAALKSFQTSLEIRQKLAQADPGSARGQYDLSAIHDRIGNIFARTGDNQAALQSYYRIIEIDQKLVDADATNARALRELSVGQIKVGDMLVKTGDAAGALEIYRKSLAIRQQLADADPTSVRAQRDLSVCYERIGRIQEKQGKTAEALQSFRRCLEIFRKLAEAAPNNANAHRDVAIAHGKIGDMLADSGDAKGALENYRQSLAISEKLAAADSKNTEACGDVSDGNQRIGDVLYTSNDIAGALEHYTKSLEIREQLARADPGNAATQRQLWESFMRIAGMHETMGGDSNLSSAQRIDEWRQARVWYMRNTAQFDAMKQKNILLPNDMKRADEVHGNVGRCDAAIAELMRTATRPATAPATQPGH